MNIIGLSYNHSVTYLAVGIQNGYLIYSLEPNIEKIQFTEKNGGVGIMKLLHKTNISLLVGGGTNPFCSPETLILWDDFLKKSVIEIQINEPIKNVFISQDRIVIILKKKIDVFNFNGSLIGTMTTYINELGLCSLWVDDNKTTLVTLGTKKGEICIWKLNLSEIKNIEAHNSNIDALAISQDGKLIATASETGTLIRIFNTESGEKLYEFRRGTKSAKIYDLCFNNAANLLVCCSDSGTVHIFDLYKDIKDSKNIQSYLSGAKNYLPNYFSSQWGFKQIYLECSGKMICGFDSNNILHVTTYEGKYFKITGENFDDIKMDNLHTFEK